MRGRVEDSLGALLGEGKFGWAHLDGELRHIEGETLGLRSQNHIKSKLFPNEESPY